MLPTDLPLLLTGATGLPRRSVDTRLPNVNGLPNGPYQITPGIPYDAYAASPVHRFFQMWQQLDCTTAHASTDNPSGCLNDLFPWVEVTVGPGSNGKSQPASFGDHSRHPIRRTRSGNAQILFSRTSSGAYRILGPGAERSDLKTFAYLAEQFFGTPSYSTALIVQIALLQSGKAAARSVEQPTAIAAGERARP